jgi:hypothetical protein
VSQLCQAGQKNDDLNAERKYFLDPKRERALVSTRSSGLIIWSHLPMHTVVVAGDHYFHDVLPPSVFSLTTGHDSSELRRTNAAKLGRHRQRRGDAGILAIQSEAGAGRMGQRVRAAPSIITTARLRAPLLPLREIDAL